MKIILMIQQMELNTITLILTLIIAVITVTILVLQYFLAKQRWRLNLYEKRIKVYLDVQKHLSNIATGHLSGQDNIEFLRKTIEIDFLFKKKIQVFLKEIYTKGNDFILTEKFIENPNSERQHLENIKKNGELRKWFSEQSHVSKELFKKYLSITKK